MDGRRFLLQPGMSYQVVDDAAPHRSPHAAARGCSSSTSVAPAQVASPDASFRDALHPGDEAAGVGVPQMQMLHVGSGEQVRQLGRFASGEQRLHG
jgi:hypothetical protein